MIDVVFNNSTTEKKIRPDFFKKIIRQAAGCLVLNSKNAELSVNLVGMARIKYLNRKYRKKNKPTDVLSFPLNQKVDAKSAISGIIPLGDIFICFPIAKQDAKKEGMNLDFKLAFLTIHGFLHLLGYDHEGSAKEKKEMFKLQEKITKDLNF